jgi:hypothetical protein
LQYNARYIQR